jgi:hypothetical protein
MNRLTGYAGSTFLGSGRRFSGSGIAQAVRVSASCFHVNMVRFMRLGNHVRLATAAVTIGVATLALILKT